LNRHKTDRIRKRPMAVAGWNGGCTVRSGQVSP
jgi:hypothetical protein